MICKRFLSHTITRHCSNSGRLSMLHSNRCFWRATYSTKDSSSNSDQKPDEQPKQDHHKEDLKATNEVNDEDVKKIQDLEKQIKELKDHYLRALADAENLRERTRREKELAQQLAIKGFAVDLLSVADVLDIALDSVPEEKRKDESNPLLKNLYEGLSMTSKEMYSTFKRHGLENFDPLGEKYDPNTCQAMFQAPMPDKEPGTVFSVTKKGYKLNGIVVRAAQVGVVMEQN